MAMDSVADYIADVRVLLQDVISPYRYTDGELYTALNLTVFETRRLRPDFFLCGSDWELNDLQEFTLPQSGLASDDTTFIPFEQQFRLAIIHGIVAHALARDQEDIQDGRSALFMGVFTQMLVGSVVPIATIRPQGK